MSDNATKDDVATLISASESRLEAMVNRTVNKAVEDLSEIIASFAQSVDDRFNKVEAAISRLETNVDYLNEKVAGHDKRFDELTNTLDTFLKRLDDNEVNNAARDAQIARMERWINQIATKTGIKLEY